MFMLTVNCLRVINCEHDTDAAMRNEGYGKNHQRDKRTMSMRTTLITKCNKQKTTKWTDSDVTYDRAHCIRTVTKH